MVVFNPHNTGRPFTTWTNDELIQRGNILFAYIVTSLSIVGRTTLGRVDVL
ncbi:hypothetical protein XBP1_340001 [Xenorhabdus bovienii str. puntauvense]|uniref:Uncharacterized protein n=1 Tax=Xenorhabdus bovienii str. puntauvense TaxID=1398201 RepID=A0A077NIJ3_XENBV|nr:hypothetical protein XBP1_340001 [Xenorhabdus bovienii str. puntauvense]